MKLTGWLAGGMFLAWVGAVSGQIDVKSLYLLDDFDQGIRNRLGGYYNKFESPPSTAATFLVDDVFRGEAGRSLKIKADHKGGGFCGVWFHFFDFKADSKKFFDSRNYAFFSFWVKGEKGGEDFLIKFADETWVSKEDSVPLGQVSQYLSGGVTREWQEVLVPLNDIKNLDRMNMGGVTFDFTRSGSQTVYIDDMCFKTSAKIATPVSDKSRPSVPAAGKPASLSRALWVWNTEPLLLDAAARKAFFDFCRSEKLNVIWVQLLYSVNPKIDVYAPPREGQLAPKIQVVLQHQDKLKEFLREAHQAGFQVHALDGYPDFAQKPYHYVPLAIVDAVIEYNKQVQPDERYDGIHFDNEPYLIIGWREPKRRERILREFLELNEECQRKIRDGSQMVYGIDIPFWWGEKDEKTGKPAGMVEYKGQTKPASFHCIDLLDNVGIMNYRDTADGADGMIAHGLPLLEHGDKAKKAKIFMGVETFTYLPTQVWFAVGLPKPLFEAALEGAAKDFSQVSRVEGFRVQVFEDGTNVHVGIEVPDKPNPEQEKKIAQVMAEIAKRFGASAQPGAKDRADQIRMDAEFGISADVEWDNARPKDIPGASGGANYAGFMATSIMLPKTTFADESKKDFLFQLGEAEKEFGRHPSFGGMAIHYYDTLRTLMEKSPEKSARH